VRAGLAEGLVTMALDTPLEKLCRTLFATMVRGAFGPRTGETTQVFLPPDIHLGESI